MTASALAGLIIVVDAGVLATSLNEWPYGDDAAVLKACIVGGDRLTLVLSNRIIDAVHELSDRGIIQVTDDTLRTFLGLLQSRGRWHADDPSEISMSMPDYLNNLALREGAVVIVTHDDEVRRRATAATGLEPSAAVARMGLLSA